MIREGTIKLVDGNDLTAQETTEIMNEVMSGDEYRNGLLFDSPTS